MSQPVSAKWSVKKAVRTLYGWALAHPHAVVSYVTAIYLAVHRAGV